MDVAPLTVEVLPERDGQFSVCLMDDAGEIQDARVEVSLEAAIATAAIWARKHQTTYRIVGAPLDVRTN